MASQSTTLADAEAYLQAYGLPDGLAQLPVKLGGASLSPGEQFVKGDERVEEAPTVEWSGDKPYTLLVLDPDAPDRASATSNGSFGPFLHLLLNRNTDGTDDVKVSYMPPAPPKGNHRYIFVLLSGSLPALDSDFTSERPKWPFEEFLQGPAKSMKAEAVNFFYAKKEER